MAQPDDRPSLGPEESGEDEQDRLPIRRPRRARDSVDPAAALVAMQITDEVDWGVADFAFAGVLLGGTGLLLELAARRPGNIAYRATATAVGVAAIALGEADDAPGLVLFGGLLILGTVALAIRTEQRSD
jgi:hypothetical protein